MSRNDGTFSPIVPRHPGRWTSKEAAGTSGADADKSSGGGAPPPNGGGDAPANGSFFTKNQLRKIKAAARKEGQQQAFATDNGKNGGFKGDKGWDNRNAQAPTEWIASGRSTNWNSGGFKGSAGFQGACHYCGAYGHRENECRKKQADVRDGAVGRNAQQGWIGHKGGSFVGGKGGGGYQAPYGPANNGYKGGYGKSHNGKKGGKGKNGW